MTENKTFLREAAIDDAKLIFDWRNDPLVREVSFSSDEITWESHLNWFKRTLENPLRKIFIGLYQKNSEPFGQVRFDSKDNEAEISIVIAPDHRGKGLGLFLINEGVLKISGLNTNLQKIIAYIKPTNIASKNVFKKAGFIYSETFKTESGTDSERWILEIKKI